MKWFFIGLPIGMVLWLLRGIWKVWRSEEFERDLERLELQRAVERLKRRRKR